VCQVLKLSADISHLKSKDPEPFNFAGIISDFQGKYSENQSNRLNWSDSETK